MKRSQFSPRRAQPQEKELNREQRLALRAQRAIKIETVCDSVQIVKKVSSAQMAPASLATYFVAPMPKVGPHRNARLLAMAKGMPCLLRHPGIYNQNPCTIGAMP